MARSSSGVCWPVEDLKGLRARGLDTLIVVGGMGTRAAAQDSALISALSLCLLLRTNSVALAALAAVVTIASKFAIRVRGKHLFNPTNFGIMAMILATGQVWVSPGQWGSAAFFAFLIACLGGLVVNHASWRWLFFANLPLCLLAAWRVARLPRAAGAAPPAAPLDLAGVLLFALTACSALLWFSFVGHRFALASATSVALVGGALACGTLLALQQR